jgi:hypothetical protein
MRDNACFWLFKKTTLEGEARPETVLASLGLREGTDFSGTKDKSFEIVRSKASGASILLSKFQQRWPSVQFFYTTDRADTGAVRALLRMGKHVAYVHIPLSFLANYQLLEWHMVQLNNNLKKIEMLNQEPVDFFVRHMTSLGFELEIEGFSNRPIDSRLAWMWRRQERHQFRFSFTNHLFEPNFSPKNLGLSMGRSILLTDFLLLSDDKNFPAFLAHEIVHSTNAVQFEKYGDATGQIGFFAGSANRVGLLGESDLPAGYKRAFSTDEMEAWLITERLNPETPEQTGVSYKDFLYNQIEWLTELRRVLPGQLIENETSWVGWVRKVNSLTVYAAAPWIPQAGERYFQFTIFRGAPHEVLITIPRVQDKIEQTGALEFLLDTVDRRLAQLNNRARLVNSN